MTDTQTIEHALLLIARDREHVLEWQWAANESARACSIVCVSVILFERIDA